ncbi:MAG: glycosyltransferase family A protein [Blastocatellia bacterium]
MKISVLICTRNRATSLRDTLEAVFNQTPSRHYDYELIVVDNGSTDNTRLMVAEFISALPAQHKGRLRYFYESHPGVSFARNAGLQAARGEVLVFTDDDILPEPTWLREIHHEFTADPKLCLLGGRVLLAHNGLQPVGIVTGEEAMTVTTPDGASLVIGANFAFRRNVLAYVGGFDTRLGAGSFFGGGEDVDFVYRAMKQGYKLLYAPNVLVYHNHDRTSHEQACKLEYNYGRGAIAYFLKHIFKGDVYALKIAYWSLRKKLTFSRRATTVSQDLTDRSRAYLRGVADALFPALVKMW